MSLPSAENFAGTDRFTLKRKLGAGANGVVYLAYDQERSHHVALKTLSKVSPSALYRFKNEFRQLVDLQHPQLVSLFNIFSERDYWFFTMEFIEGTDYVSFVRSHEKIDCDRNHCLLSAMQIILACITACATCHFHIVGQILR